jgi:hypothetical protein
MDRRFAVAFVIGATAAACGARTGLPVGVDDAASSSCPAPGCFGSCVVCCEVDLRAGQATACAGRVSGVFGNGTFTASVDMSSLEEMELRFVAEDPAGWIAHVADSPSCDGGGGDSSDFANDAEVQLRDGTLTAFANDLDPKGPSTTLLSSNGYVAPEDRCVERTWIVSDQRFRSVDPPLDVSSPFLLRLNPPSDSEGAPDAMWFIGLNRTFGDASRGGTGVIAASICLR